MRIEKLSGWPSRSRDPNVIPVRLVETMLVTSYRTFGGKKRLKPAAVTVAASRIARMVRIARALRVVDAETDAAADLFAEILRRAGGQAFIAAAVETWMTILRLGLTVESEDPR